MQQPDQEPAHEWLSATTHRQCPVGTTTAPAVDVQQSAAYMLDALEAALFDKGDDGVLVRLVYEAFGEADWAPELLVHLQVLLVGGALGDPACVPLLRALQRIEQLLDEEDQGASLARRTAAIVLCMRRLRFDWAAVVVHAIATRDATFRCGTHTDTFIGDQWPPAAVGSGCDGGDAILSLDEHAELLVETTLATTGDCDVETCGQRRLHVARLCMSLWYWRYAHQPESTGVHRFARLWSLVQRIAQRMPSGARAWLATLDRLEYVANAAPYAAPVCLVAALLMFTCKRPLPSAFDERARDALVQWKGHVTRLVQGQPSPPPQQSVSTMTPSRRTMVSARLLFDWPQHARWLLRPPGAWPLPGDDDGGENESIPLPLRSNENDTLHASVGALLGGCMPDASLYRLAYACAAADTVLCAQQQRQTTSSTVPAESSVAEEAAAPAKRRLATSAGTIEAAVAKRSRSHTLSKATAGDRLPEAPHDVQHQCAASQLFAETALFESATSASSYGKARHQTFFVTVRAATAAQLGVEHGNAIAYLCVGPCTHESYCDALQTVSAARQVLAFDDMYPAPSAVHRLVLRANVHNATQYRFDTYMTYMLLRLPPPYNVVVESAVGSSGTALTAALFAAVDEGDDSDERAVWRPMAHVSRFGLGLVDPISSRFRGTPVYTYSFTAEQRVAYMMQIVWRFVWQMPSTPRIYCLSRSRIVEHNHTRFIAKVLEVYTYVRDDTVLLKPRPTLYRKRVGTRLRAAIEAVLRDDMERTLLQTALERVADRWSEQQDALAATINAYAASQQTTGADVVRHAITTYRQLSAALGGNAHNTVTGDSGAESHVHAMWSNIL